MEIWTFRSLCKAARAMLGWNQERLAVEANIAKQTVADFERGARKPMRNNLQAIQDALENAGIEFLNDENGAGVILSHKSDEGSLANV